MGDTHLLKLAYLAEVSIVFNLAYYELKWKEAFKELQSDSGKWMSFANEVEKKDICLNCKRVCATNNGRPFVTYENSNKIVEIGNTLNANPFSIFEPSDKTSLYSAWAGSYSRWKVVLWLFHNSARKQMDKYFSLSLLAATVFILYLATLIDNGLAPLWFSVESPIWFNTFFSLLTISIASPCFFWWVWHKFLREHKCLSIMLSKEYQVKKTTEQMTTKDNVERAEDALK